MRRALQVTGLIVSLTTPLNAGTKAYEEQPPAAPFSLCVVSEPDRAPDQDPKGRLKGRDKATARSVKEIRKYARKQYSKWLVLADSPVQAEIVVNIKDTTHEKHRKEITIEGTAKILDLYDGPIASSYTYCDTGSPGWVDKWRDSAKQFVAYLKHICERNLVVLEEHRELFHAVQTGEVQDVRRLWQDILDAEDRILISHNRLTNLARQNAITDQEVADDLQREVLQPWQENMKLLSQMSVHESQEELHSLIMSYMKLREEGWRSLISAFRGGGDEKLLEANKKQKDAQRSRALIQDMQRRPRGFQMYF